MKIIIPKKQTPDAPNFFVQYDMAYPYAIYSKNPVHDGTHVDIELFPQGTVGLKGNSEHIVLCLRNMPNNS